VFDSSQLEVSWMNDNPEQEKRFSVLYSFKTIIIFILLVLMAIIIVISVIYLVWSMIDNFVLGGIDIKNIDKGEILHIFGLLLVVIIGLELMDLLLGYVRKGVLQIQLVLFIAIIAVAREFVIYNYDTINGVEPRKHGCCRGRSGSCLLLDL
jgi:uncharacterized membrane protein (DUF373 family)